MPTAKRFWVPALRRNAMRCVASGTREHGTHGAKKPRPAGETGRGLMSDYAMRASLK
jgi:hypothetical protein